MERINMTSKMWHNSLEIKRQLQQHLVIICHSIRSWLMGPITGTAKINVGRHFQTILYQNGRQDRSSSSSSNSSSGGASICQINDTQSSHVSAISRAQDFGSILTNGHMKIIINITGWSHWLAATWQKYFIHKLTTKIQIQVAQLKVSVLANPCTAPSNYFVNLYKPYHNEAQIFPEQTKKGIQNLKLNN